MSIRREIYDSETGELLGWGRHSPGTIVYAVIHEDRHADTEVYLFTGKDAAISHAEALAADAAWHPDSLKLDCVLTDGMRYHGWVRYIPYGSEGDSVRVVKRELRDG